MDEDKDDESFGGEFDDGEWVWDDVSRSLIFLQHHVKAQEEAIVIPKVVVMGAVQFKEIDLIEQIRFRKRYQRKLRAGQPDIISLQDVKDLAIYTAPLSIMSSAVINMLHLPTTERFLRALILYCQYYLQVAQDMSIRMAELDRKIRTPVTVEIETDFRNDLCDLRCLVVKEYSTILMGGQETRKYHHMGPDKKKKSLSDKDARFIESFLLVSIQIVWIALGRRSFNQIELEINRLFKTDNFNPVEHRLKTKYYAKLSPEERNVLLGHCLLHESKVYTRSPLIDEVSCFRKVDYRMLGLGTIKYKELPHRLGYMLTALTAPEEDLAEAKVCVGILGKPRALFDIALHLLPVVEVKTHSNQEMTSNKSVASRDVNKSDAADERKIITQNEKLYGYANIVLPAKSPGQPPYPPSFLDEDAPVRACNERQRKRWVNRLYRLTHAHDRYCSEYNASMK